MCLRNKTSPIVLSCWSGLGILRPADYLTMFFLLPSQPARAPVEPGELLRAGPDY